MLNLEIGTLVCKDQNQWDKLIVVRPEADLQVLMLSVRSSHLFKIGVRLRRTYVLQHIYKWANVKMTLKFHFLWSTLFCTTEGRTARPHRRTLGILKSTMVSIETVMALSCFQTNQLTGHKAFREKRQSCWEKRQGCWEKRQSCREKRANYVSWNIGSTHIKSILYLFMFRLNIPCQMT